MLISDDYQLIRLTKWLLIILLLPAMEAKSQKVSPEDTLEGYAVKLVGDTLYTKIITRDGFYPEAYSILPYMDSTLPLVKLYV